MRAKEYPVAEMCVENGLVLGWNRAHKHVSKPSPEAIREAQAQAVLTELCEWFDFPEPGEHEERREVCLCLTCPLRNPPVP